MITLTALSFPDRQFGPRIEPREGRDIEVGRRRYLAAVYTELPRLPPSFLLEEAESVGSVLRQWAVWAEGRSDV